VKVSIATTLSHVDGGQFVTPVKAMHGMPYDGHSLAVVIPEIEALISNSIERAITDKGYRGHNASPYYKFRVFITCQKRRMTPAIKRDETAVGRRARHRASQSRAPDGPNYLARRLGDAANAVLAAAGYNFRLLIRWLRLLLFIMLIALGIELQLNPT
jgi:IS5 family transposase